VARPLHGSKVAPPKRNVKGAQMLISQRPPHQSDCWIGKKRQSLLHAPLMQHTLAAARVGFFSLPFRHVLGLQDGVQRRVHFLGCQLCENTGFVPGANSNNIEGGVPHTPHPHPM
jgi:hypothetical protein